MNKKYKKYFKNKLILGGAILVLLVVIFMIFSGGANGDYETAVADIGSVIETVSVTGKVAPFSKADLGFEVGGIVSNVNVKVGDPINKGDLIASLDTSDSYASLQGAQANLQAEQVRLAEMRKGLRPEELTVEEAKLSSSNVDFEDAKVGLLNGLHDAYVKTEDTLFNYTDQFFDYPQSVVPRIDIRVDSLSKEKEVNKQRFTVTEGLREWKEYLDSVSASSDPSKELTAVHGYLLNVKIFLSNMSEIVSDLSTGNSGLSQSEIDSYNSTINSALSKFNTAVASLTSTEATYKSVSSALALAKEEYELKKSGSSPEALQAQEAKVAQASASVLGYQVDIAKRRILSPIDGIVSKSEPKLGEFVSAGEVVFGVIGDNLYKVEINVPEVDIAKIAIDNSAKITLDAYGDEVEFPGKVTSIDPAETVIEGIPTYKVTLQFDEKDERIRSGMTANIDIITQSKDGVLVVPTRAVIRKDGKSYVRVLENGEYTEVIVQVGTRGSNGMTEIVSGIDKGDTVVTSVK